MATLVRTLTGSSQRSAQLKDGGPHSAPALARMTTTNAQTGILNHLSEQQTQLLEDLKKKLHNDGWWSPDGINGKPTHDDGTLLRYLRARKFDVEGAYGQFTDTEKWLKEQHVEELYEHFDVDFYERARQMYPQWTGHRDKRGIPLYVFEIKGLDSKAIDKYQKEADAYKKNSPKHKSLSTASKLLPLFALYHNLLNFVLPLCSSLDRPQSEVPITNSTNIVDISGVSLRQFWNLKAHMQDASTLATAHYPETLDRIFIIGAPSFFPTVWGWVKRWFDPVTVSKIFILGRNEVKPTLEKFMEPSSIPKKYGGGLDWSWGEPPAIDDETRSALERDGYKGWVKGPALWLNHERIVVGSENGKMRRSIQEIAEKKPIVYAADYTDDPVHPEKKRASVVSRNNHSISSKGASRPDGIVSSEDPNALIEEHEQQQRRPSAAAVAAAVAAPAAAASTTEAIAAQGAQYQPQSQPEPHSNPQEHQQHQEVNVPAANVKTSPMGDAQVHVPTDQPAAPATTAEYISPTPSNTNPPPQSASLPAPAAHITQPRAPPAAPASLPAPEPINTTAPAAAAPAPVPSSEPATPTPNPIINPHPPGMTQPGPLSHHQAAVNRAIADKLDLESTVLLPATANGALPHPDIIVSSDPTKGLAMEADKLALQGKPNGRPQPERFVTAMEVPHPR